MVDARTIDEGFYKVDEVAEMLRMSPHNVRRLAREGHLEAYRRGGDGGMLIPRPAVRALLIPAARPWAESGPNRALHNTTT